MKRGACLLVFLLCCAQAALPGQEGEQWYLIRESELRSIERYRETSEAERRAWLLQAGALKTQAGNLAERSAALEAESAALNRQLAQAREAQRRSEALYEQSEAAWLTQISLKDGEIAGLRESLAAEKLTNQKIRNQRNIAFAVIGLFIAVAAIIVYCKVRYGMLHPP